MDINQKVEYSRLQIFVFCAMTPLVLIFSFMKMRPQCKRFRSKIINMKRIGIYVVLVSNILSCINVFIDFVYLGYHGGKDLKYCEFSGSI